jgi:hypothetical protein
MLLHPYWRRIDGVPPVHPGKQKQESVLEQTDDALDPFTGPAVHLPDVTPLTFPGVADDGQVLLNGIMDQNNAGHHKGTVGEAEGWMPVRDLFHEPYHIIPEKPHCTAEKPRQTGGCAH